jgi:hypothetical protein
MSAKQYIKNFKDIVVGWSNYLFNNEDAKKHAEYKANICSTCPLNDNGTCSSTKYGTVVRDFIYKEAKRLEGQEVSGCGCPLNKKLLSDSPCPLGKF